MKYIFLLSLLISSTCFAITAQYNAHTRQKHLDGLIHLWAKRQACLQDAKSRHITVPHSTIQHCNAEYQKGRKAYCAKIKGCK